MTLFDRRDKNAGGRQGNEASQRSKGNRGLVQRVGVCVLLRRDRGVDVTMPCLSRARDVRRGGVIWMWRGRQEQDQQSEPERQREGRVAVRKKLYRSLFVTYLRQDTTTTKNTKRMLLEIAAQAGMERGDVEKRSRRMGRRWKSRWNGGGRTERDHRPLVGRSPVCGRQFRLRRQPGHCDAHCAAGATARCRHGTAMG